MQHCTQASSRLACACAVGVTKLTPLPVGSSLSETGTALHQIQPSPPQEASLFLGTIEPEVRAIVQEHVRDWDVEDIYVGCSGAFTIERFLGPLGHRMHGNDVAIYTSQLGKYLSGQPVDLALRPESADELAWLEPYLQDDADRVATMMLGTRFLQYVGKPAATSTE